MSKPESFILTTDYGTLKNDDTDTVSVTVPGGMTLTAAQLYTATATLAIGTQNASSRVRIASTKESNDFYAGSVYIVARTGTIAGPFSAPYTLVAYSTRTSPTTITVTAAITNPYAEDLLTAAVAETFTFEISTFLSPFITNT